MGNVLEKAKQEQVIALGRLGWSLRRIGRELGVHRETVARHLQRAPQQSKPANAPPGSEAS